MLMRFSGGKTFHRARRPKLLLEAGLVGQRPLPLMEIIGVAKGGKRVIGERIPERFVGICLNFPSPEFPNPPLLF